MTALDVAVHKFAIDPKANKLFEPNATELGKSSLGDCVKNKKGDDLTLGIILSGNSNFSKLFCEQQMPKRLFEECLKANQKRNKVAHEGEEICKEELYKSLSEIREMCSILRTYQEDA